MTHLRRILLAVTIFLVVGWLYKTWRDQQPGPGLFNFLSQPESGGRIQDTDIPNLVALDREISLLAAKVLPSVVSINTSTVKREPLGFFFGYENRVIPGLGSGVIVSSEGHILTNNHVIAGTNQILVTTNDQRTYQAVVVGTDVVADVAVIKIVDVSENFPVLEFADSDDVQVGQMVFAVGNPFGLSGTFTQGVISATQRRFSDTSNNLLQTDTVINPGNSGGPLVSIHGEIIGINFSIYRGDDKVQAWQGIGLAIPANDVKASWEAIMHTRPVSTPYLGIGLQKPGLDSSIDTGVGVVIETVNPGSPADKAGLKVGDVIVTVNKDTITSPHELFLLVRSSSIGEIMTFRILRNNQPLTLQAQIQARPLD